MEVLLLIIPLAFIIGLLFLGAFWWSVNNGQLDDLDSPQLKMLIDDEIVEKNKKTTKTFKKGNET